MSRRKRAGSRSPSSSPRRLCLARQPRVLTRVLWAAIPSRWRAGLPAGERAVAGRRGNAPRWASRAVAIATRSSSEPLRPSSSRPHRHPPTVEADRQHTAGTPEVLLTKQVIASEGSGRAPPRRSGSSTRASSCRSVRSASSRGGWWPSRRAPAPPRPDRRGRASDSSRRSTPAAATRAADIGPVAPRGRVARQQGIDPWLRPAHIGRTQPRIERLQGHVLHHLGAGGAQQGQPLLQHPLRFGGGGQEFSVAGAAEHPKPAAGQGSGAVRPLGIPVGADHRQAPGPEWADPGRSTRGCRSRSRSGTPPRWGSGPGWGAATPRRCTRRAAAASRSCRCPPPAAPDRPPPRQRNRRRNRRRCSRDPPHCPPARGAGQAADAEGEFVHGGLAHHDRPGLPQPRQQRCIAAGLIPEQGQGSHRHRQIEAGDVVLHRKGQAVQRPAGPARRHGPIERLRLGQRRGVQGLEGVERRSGARVSRLRSRMVVSTAAIRSRQLGWLRAGRPRARCRCWIRGQQERCHHPEGPAQGALHGSGPRTPPQLGGPGAGW